MSLKTFDTWKIEIITVILLKVTTFTDIYYLK